LSSFSLLYKAMVVGDWLQDVDSGGLAQLAIALVERLWQQQKESEWGHW
jgi:hypothetical protein